VVSHTRIVAHVSDKPRRGTSTFPRRVGTTVEPGQVIGFAVQFDCFRECFQRRSRFALLQLTNNLSPKFSNCWLRKEDSSELLGDGAELRRARRLRASVFLAVTGLLVAHWNRITAPATRRPNRQASILGRGLFPWLQAGCTGPSWRDTTEPSASSEGHRLPRCSGRESHLD
jgi:hypothetical protein